MDQYINYTYPCYSFMTSPTSLLLNIFASSFQGFFLAFCFIEAICCFCGNKINGLKIIQIRKGIIIIDINYTKIVGIYNYVG